MIMVGVVSSIKANAEGEKCGTISLCLMPKINREYLFDACSIKNGLDVSDFSEGDGVVFSPARDEATGFYFAESVEHAVAVKGNITMYDIGKKFGFINGTTYFHISNVLDVPFDYFIDLNNYRYGVEYYESIDPIHNSRIAIGIRIVSETRVSMGVGSFGAYRGRYAMDGDRFAPVPFSRASVPMNVEPSCGYDAANGYAPLPRIKLPASICDKLYQFFSSKYEDGEEFSLADLGNWLRLSGIDYREYGYQKLHQFCASIPFITVEYRAIANNGVQSFGTFHKRPVGSWSGENTWSEESADDCEANVPCASVEVDDGEFDEGQNVGDGEEPLVTEESAVDTSDDADLEEVEPLGNGVLDIYGEKWGKISEKRNRVEQALREFVPRQLRAAVGEEIARRKIIDALNNRMYYNYNVLGLSCEELCAKAYWIDIVHMVVNNWADSFSCVFSDKVLFRSCGYIVNSLRSDCHARPVSDCELELFLGAIGWLEQEVERACVRRMR